ncbi:hypothetical protein KSP40_PGU018776 [Platanthera guangdongensis]|uniref:UspA domain-containing protein n=1 Tax=Platanthera guangdongensis TaxID=2320717 RepID=A0ABR2LIV0_9ASPA
MDESEGSLHALKWALDHIIRLAAAAAVVGDSDPAEQPAGRLVLLHVQQPVNFFVPPVVGPPPVLVTESVKKSQEENSARLLSKAMKVCMEREVEAQTMTVEGDPKEMICEAVDKMQADILVLGSRGLSKWKR